MNAVGSVIKAFGNLVHVTFDGDICQGEVAFVIVDDTKMLSEVIEIKGNIAKLQVFEDTYGIALGTKIEFCGHLLEAELGPGLASSIFDGLQNPLQNVADKAGVFLKRGLYFPPLNRTLKWQFKPYAKPGDTVERGDTLGVVQEGLLEHHIMVPFSLNGKYTLDFVAQEGSYTVDEVIASAPNEKFTMVQRWPIKKMLQFGEREPLKEIMSTGLRILDTQFPIVKGGTFCVPGPFGAGKTILQHHLSKHSSVDLVVLIACGERAGEVVEVLKTFPELTDKRTNEPLIKRTVIICNTSSMPVAAREASVYTGITIGEYYRQMGLNVLALADSTSRWAQAMREMSGRLEEIPGEEAFPAYLSSRIAAFYERAGNLAVKGNRRGTLTIGGAVSPAGGNFEEPVTKATLTSVGAFYGLSRERSDARRYPAIDPLISWTNYLDIVGLAEKGWVATIKAMEDLIRNSADIGKRIEVVGHEGISLDELLIHLKGELYESCYLQQNAFDKEDAYCSLERQKALFAIIQNICNLQFKFDKHEVAINFFLGLQSKLKNMNFSAFQSDQYKEIAAKIEHSLSEVS